MAVLKILTVVFAVLALSYGRSPQKYLLALSDSVDVDAPALPPPQPEGKPEVQQNPVMPEETTQTEAPVEPPLPETTEPEEAPEETDDDTSDFEESDEEIFRFERGRTKPFDESEEAAIAAIKVKEETERSICAKIRSGSTCNAWCYYQRRAVFIWRYPSLRCCCYY